MFPKMMVAARIETKSTSCTQLDTVRCGDQPSFPAHAIRRCSSCAPLPICGKRREGTSVLTRKHLLSCQGLTLLVCASNQASVLLER